MSVSQMVTQNQYFIYPKPHLKSYQKLVRKLKQLTDRSWSISLDNRIKKINYVVRGWVNYFRIANMKNKITEIDEHLRVRIRVIIWKQWKKIRKKCESLQKLGVPFEIAFNCANAKNIPLGLGLFRTNPTQRTIGISSFGGICFI